MQHAVAIASFGYLSPNPALLGYIISYAIEDAPGPIPPNQPFYDRRYDLGIGAGGRGTLRPDRDVKRITVKFQYEDNTYEETKYVAYDIEIGIKDMEIKVINDLPTVTFRNLELKYGNIDSLSEQT